MHPLQLQENNHLLRSSISANVRVLKKQYPLRYSKVARNGRFLSYISLIGLEMPRTCMVPVAPAAARSAVSDQQEALEPHLR